VKASFHRDDRQAGQTPADELSAMTGHRGAREVRNAVVLDRGRGFDLPREAAEARAEDDAGARGFASLATDEIGGGLDLVVEMEHG
jgi:hypothetical protein